MKIVLTLALFAAFSLHAAGRGDRSATAAEWRNVHRAGISRELRLLVDSRECRRAAKAELGDAGLFELIARLLKKHFRRYDVGTVDAALRQLKALLPAVDPVRAATDLTHIRSRVELAADKNPQKWRATLAALDETLNELKANYR